MIHFTMSILFTGVTKIFCGTQHQSVQSYEACTCQQAPEELVALGLAIN